MKAAVVIVLHMLLTGRNKKYIVNTRAGCGRR